MIRVLALHGFLGQGSDWVQVFDELRKFEIPYQSFTPSLFAPYSDFLVGDDFEDWARKFLKRADVAAFLNEKPSITHKNILIGYSFGGRLALYLGLAAPELWSEIILISAHSGLISEAEKLGRAVSDEEWAGLLNRTDWMDFLNHWNNQPIFANSLEPRRSEGDFNKSLLQSALQKFSLSKMTIDGEMMRSLKSCHWVYGESDLKFARLYGQLEAQGLIKGPIKIPRSGHRLLFDRPDAIAELLVASAKV